MTLILKIRLRENLKPKANFTGVKDPTYFLPTPVEVFYPRYFRVQGKGIIQGLTLTSPLTFELRSKIQ